ncbi:MAG: prolyl oligopeptidase family serine peptidase [Burkholderiaceae bacterium]|nr:prolyl oligopeptidase family serine peptidase [Burkholderiaceae bacterium]
MGVALWASSCVLAQTPTAPPARPANETFFGTEVPDPYRWLEDVKSPEVAAWMKSHSDYTMSLLARIPGRKTMFDRNVKYEEAVPSRVKQVARETGDRWFLERRGASQNQFKLLMRQGLRGEDRVLVDPEAVEKRTGKPHAINYYSASPGGALVAYGLSAQGSEAAVLHVLDTRTGKAVGQPIDRADFATVSFSPDSRTLFFNRLQELKPGMPETEKYQKSQVLMIKRGADVGRAVPVFGVGVPGVEIGPAEIPIAGVTHDGRWALGLVFNGTQREIGLFVAPAAGVLAGKPKWRRIIDPRDEVTGVAYFNNTLALLSHKGAPRSQVLRIDLRKPELSDAQVLLAQSDRVVTGITAAADALYIEARDGNVKRLFKRAHAAEGTVVEVKLPVEGSFQLSGDEGALGAADPRFPGLVLELQGWNRARQIYLVAADGSVRNSGLQPEGPFDTPADVVATEVKVKSHDGAMVPMSIIHRRGTTLDGRNPTILYGYASYGITEEPFYSVSRLAWLDAGGVYAIANPRGSGVYGQEWYKGGFQATKPNTWKDFIACAEWLIAQKWTSPDRLGILGGSAGGILVGRAMTERPDLFVAAVPVVGVLDAVRAEVTPNGVPNIPEFGTRTNEAGFRALLGMSTYHQIVDGKKYPAVLLTHGVNDPRVEVWHSTKTAARLMAAQAGVPAGRNPVLLRLDFDAGHGVGSTKAQQLQQRADIFTFFLWQMGIEGYQPTTASK